MVVKWSPLAVNSLKDIYEFYLPSTGRSKALKIVAELRAETRYLLIYPTIGTTELIDNADLGYRYIVKGHCKIYYTIHPQYVRISFIWDTRRDPQLLSKFLK